MACCSCGARRGISHYSTLFPISLQTEPHPVPGSDVAVRLVSVDSAAQQACLEFTKEVSRDRIQECLTNRAVFDCKGWFGTRGLRLAEVREQSVLLERWGARAR
jgi:hypothetical protein